jgi:hypothetical protein
VTRTTGGTPLKVGPVKVGLTGLLPGLPRERQRRGDTRRRAPGTAKGAQHFTKYTSPPLAWLAKAGIPSSSGAGGVGLFPANSDTQKVPCFRRWRFEMKHSPFLVWTHIVEHNFFHSNNNNKGLSFISNRQRRKEGTFCASGLAGIEPTPARPNGAGYARLNLSATAGINWHRRKLLLKCDFAS